MKLAIMQPYFFPYLGYFQGIHAVDTYMLYSNLNYIKEGWVHRNRILINGTSNYISPQLEQKSSNKKINEISLVSNDFWKKKLLKSIFLSYKNAPYFDEIFPTIEAIILKNHQFLFEINQDSIVTIAHFLEVDTKIITNTKVYDSLEEKLFESTDYKEDFPNIISTNYEQKVIRVLEICKSEQADVFVNAIGGSELYFKDEFKANNIDVFFVKTLAYDYPQKNTTEFVPHLSIIDVLMNCGKKHTQQLLTQYELI